MVNFRTRVRNNYSDEEKMGIIQEYLTTDVSMNRISRKYRIGYYTIPHWMRIFGIPMPTASDQCRMGDTKTTEGEEVSRDALESRVKELQAALDREKLKNLALTTMIEVAEKELHISIRKKAGAKQ